MNPKYGVLGLLVMPLGVVALIASMALFVLTLVDVPRTIARTISMQGDVPWLHSLSLPSFDWFYLPLTGIFMLGIVGIGIVVTIMLIGKHISGSQKNIALDMVWYVLFYSFIAPLWLFRSARDVALGYNRAWR